MLVGMEDHKQSEGEVAGFTEQRYYVSMPPAEWMVWSFRVERQQLPAISVEMRGISNQFSGTISNGDIVQVPRKRRGGLWRTDRIQNLTTGSLVRSADGPAGCFYPLILLIIVGAVVAALSFLRLSIVALVVGSPAIPTKLIEQPLLKL